MALAPPRLFTNERQEGSNASAHLGNAYESRLRTAFDHEGGGSGGESIPGIGGGEASLADLLDGPAGWQTDLADRVESDLGQVRGRPQAQEQGLSELVGFLEERRSLLASTPSLMPTRGWVTSGYQRRSDPFTQNEVWHRGVDISAGLGTPVMAPPTGWSPPSAGRWTSATSSRSTTATAT